MYIYASTIFISELHEAGHRSMITAAIAGASGYSGLELLGLLARREDVCVRHVFAASSAGKSVADIAPSLARVTDLRFTTFDPETAAGADVLFCALPHGEAMSIIPGMLPRVGRIIDLGGDFRLTSAELYRTFYGRDHLAPGLLGRAVYGLPEINAGRIAAAHLVANPGCYPTGSILALLPVLHRGIASPSGIVITALSGITGAGKTSSADYSFSELNENVRAYKIGVHQHLPEISGVLAAATGAPVSLSFVPHLIPSSRGIYTTIHAPLRRPVAQEEIQRVYEEYYADARFVRVRKDIPQLKDVLRTNYCDIGVRVDAAAGQLVIVSVLDNLVKGAAGQAVQNMNIMFNCPQDRGLL